MPKINLTFDEFLDIVSVLDLWADEIKVVDMAEAKKLLDLNAALHLRYAKASVEEDLSQAETIYCDTDSVRLHPDAQLPDSIYSPDPEDFS